MYEYIIALENKIISQLYNEDNIDRTPASIFCMCINFIVQFM